jgi:hypothetical protein
MKLHLMISAAAAVCWALGAPSFSAGALSGEKKTAPAAESAATAPPVASPSAKSAKQATPTAAPAWFEGIRVGWFADRIGRDDDVTLASDDQAPTLPQLGPLADDAEFGNTTLSYDGPIIDLTDDYAESDPAMYSYGGQPYDLHLMPQGLIYRSYMAGAKESRFRSVWHEEEGGHSIWDITLGGNVGILRYGTRGDHRPEGLQLGIEGAGLVRLDRDSQIDVAATDYRFGIPLTWGDSIYQVKFAYYHLSSHVGDEFLLGHPGFQRLNYSRDTFVWGHSLYPADSVRLYAEIGYAFYIDVCEPWELQFGVDYGPNGRTGARGAPFAAFNGHLREETDFGGNFVAQAGWAWRRSPATGMYRLGVEYYNGKDDQFSFFNRSVEKIGLGMWYDY